MKRINNKKLTKEIRKRDAIYEGGEEGGQTNETKMCEPKK